MSKRRIAILTITIAISVSLFFPRTHLSALDDASSLQCSGGTVLAGDSEDSVRDKCGDPQKVTQEDAAFNMGVSRRAFWEDLQNARKKVALALIAGMAIEIAGGNHIDTGKEQQ